MSAIGLDNGKHLLGASISGFDPELTSPNQAEVRCWRDRPRPGLTICRVIIESHGGSLKALANKPYGSIFEVTLPSGDLGNSSIALPVTTFRHLPSHPRQELEQFFLATNALEDKKLEFLGLRGPSRAAKTIKRPSRQ
jgi:hypothetical protein